MFFPVFNSSITILLFWGPLHGIGVCPTCWEIMVQQVFETLSVCDDRPKDSFEPRDLVIHREAIICRNFHRKTHGLLKQPRGFYNQLGKLVSTIECLLLFMVLYEHPPRRSPNK